MVPNWINSSALNKLVIGLTQTKLIFKIAPLSSTLVHLEFDGNLFDPIIVNLGFHLIISNVLKDFHIFSCCMWLIPLHRHM